MLQPNPSAKLAQSPSLQSKLSIPQATPRRSSVTPQTAQPRKASATPKLLAAPNATGTPQPVQPRKNSSAPQPTTTPRPTQSQKYSTTPKPISSPNSLSPPNLAECKSTISPSQRELGTAQVTPRKLSATPQSNQLRKLSTTPKALLPPQPAQPRKHSTSPPKPDWIPPPGKHCGPSPSASPSPSSSLSLSQIPTPVFLSSARKENSLVPLRRKSGVVRSSPLSRWIDDEGDAASLSTDGDRSGGVRLSVRGGGKEERTEGEKEEEEKEERKEEKEEEQKEEKKEVRGLGLSSKDPFSSTPGSGLGFGYGYGYGSFSAPATLVGRRVDTSPASPASPSQLSLTIAATKNKQQDDDTAEEMSKRDSLSPTSIPYLPKSLLSRKYLSTPHTTLPPSPSTTHPYTGNTHITPSCTSGSLTHRLDCGHLVLTERVEVCGRNCVAGLLLTGVEMDQEEGAESVGGKEKDGKEGMGIKGRNGRREFEGREQGFRPNMRDLDAKWMCPCCGIEREKGKRCVYVLGVGC